MEPRLKIKDLLIDQGQSCGQDRELKARNKDKAKYKQTNKLYFPQT